MAAGKLEKKKRQKKAAVFQFASCQAPASFRETKPWVEFSAGQVALSFASLPSPAPSFIGTTATKLPQRARPGGEPGRARPTSSRH